MRIVISIAVALCMLLSTSAIGYGGGLKPPEIFVHTDANGFKWACRVIDRTDLCAIMPYNEVNKPQGHVAIPGRVEWDTENRTFTVVEIEPMAFQDNAKIQSVTIPESVTEIAARAFYGCSSLSRVTIGKKVSTIGQGAFTGCSSLQKFIVDKENEWFSTDEHGVLFNAKMDQILIYPGARRGDYEIPDGVASMGEHVFYGHSYITGLTIPGSIKIIPDYELRGCSLLERFTMLEGVETIGNAVCDDCPELKAIHVPSTMKSIDSYAFTHCKGPVYWLPSATDCRVSDVAFGEGRHGEEEDKGVLGKILYVRKGTSADFANLKWVKLTEFQVKEGCVVTFDGKGGMPEKLELMVGPGEKVLQLRGPRKAGHKFLGWRMVGESNLFDFSKQKITEDITLEAVYEVDSSISMQYTLTIVQPAEGSVKVTKNDANGPEITAGDGVKAGDRLFIVATATDAAKHELESLTVNGVAHANGTAYVVKANESVKVEAKFREVPSATKKYTLTIVQPAEGSVKVTKNDANGPEITAGDGVKAGDRLFIVATATDAAKHELESLTVNGVAHANGTAYVVKANESVKVEAKFREVKKQEEPNNPQTAVESILLAKIRLVCNPVGDALELEGVSAAERVEVYSLAGTRVAMVALRGEEKVSIAADGWAIGIYVARVMARDGAKVLRFLKR